MNILETIVEHKKKEVARKKLETPERELLASPLFERPVFSLRESLLNPDRNGIIAEFKRKSPSKGTINASASAASVTKAYAANGAAGLSVLTDHDFFGGTIADLTAARENNIPILRKDFIIDPYQITEAKAFGADVILLIAACLTVEEVALLSDHATQLGLEVLLELHAAAELGHICRKELLVGINNRNLKTFEVDIARSLQMAANIPSHHLKIAESGISDQATIQLFRDNGFSGFLIGENFMKEADPGQAFAKFATNLQLPDRSAG